MSLNESIVELNKLILLMEEDAGSLDVQQSLQDYLAPILGSILAEIEANRNYIVQTADRANLAMMMNEKTLLGEILAAIAENFATILGELPAYEEDSKLGAAVAEVQGLLHTWMSFDDEESDEDDEDDEDVSEDGSDVESGVEVADSNEEVVDSNEEIETNGEA
ncbi:MAG: hypothetical protein ACW99U_14370 [Candidatus Thorarchaeota archaeon]|jgi:hypothetical protein